MLWSESLFIFLSLLGIIFLINFLKEKRILLLLIASLFFGLAFFTRTIGISLAAVSVASVMFFSELKIRNRIMYSVISIFIVILPFFTWTLINSLLYGRNIEFVYHPFNPKYYYVILNPISLWVMPNKTPEKVRIILIIILIIAIISIASYMAFKNKRRNIDEVYRLNSKTIFIFLFFILFYFIALLFATYFFDAIVSIGDNRILLPVIISTFILFLFFLKRLMDFFSQKEYVKIIVYVFCGFLIATSLFNNNAIGIYNYGQWYTSNYWSRSETIEDLKRIPAANNPIYTNDPVAIYLFLGKNPNNLPVKYNSHTSRQNPNYKEDLNNIMEEIKERDGLLVLFDGGWGPFPEEQEIIEDYELYLIKDTSDGAIYKVKK
jgi:MFS family permease